MNPVPPIPSDLDIARTAKLKPIEEIAREIGLEKDEVITYGPTKAKIHLDALRRIGSNPTGKYVDVTAVTPTPLGEGKTTTTVGLVQGLGPQAARPTRLCGCSPSRGQAATTPSANNAAIAHRRR